MGGRALAMLTVCLTSVGCAGDDATESERSVVPAGSGPSSAVPVGAVAELSCLPLAPDGWSRSGDLTDLVDGVKLATDGATIVALGASAGEVGAHHSTDGLRWEPGGDLPPMELDGPVVDVAGGPNGFVAVGVSDPRDSDNGMVATPVVAFSPDGVSWERIDSESLPRSVLRWFSGVAAGPDGFIIVGTGFDREPSPTLVWYSDDGATWTEADLDLGHGPVAVTATEDGWMLLGADDADWRTGAPSRVWTSRNGVDWDAVDAGNTAPARPLFGYLGLPPLLVHDDALVLVLAGSTDDDPAPRSPTVWVSIDDGVTWTEHAVWEDPDQAGFEIHDTAVTESGVLVAGYQDEPGRPGSEFVHHSPDGISWEHCWTDSLELLAIEPLGDALVAVTGTGSVYVWNEP